VAAKNLVGYMAAATTALGMLKAAGAQVETDPRSSDFGKGRIGKTRIDLFVGYQQIARYSAQLISGERKIPDKGGVQKINRMDDVVLRFGRSKLAPAAGFAWSALSGRNYAGEDYTPNKENIGKIAYQEFTPMVVSDIIDAAREQGPLAGLLVGPASAMGIGTTTYTPKAKKSKGGFAPPKFDFKF
jgi:hypothetical protein